MGYTRNTGQLSYLITYDGSGNITVPASFTQTTVTSSMLKADSAGKLVAAVAGTDFVAPAGLSAYVPTTRTITINGTSYDLSADRSWSIVSGVSSFNTRTGAITLSSSDVTTALGYTPVTNARTLTINGTTFDLSANRSWTIVAGLSSFNTRTGDITLLDTDVTGALGYTPVTNARTITINGTTYDLSANRTWVVDTSSVSTRVVQKFTATAGQTTFTITGGYTVGMVDVFLNGVKLDNATEFTASNGSTVVLSSAAVVNDVVEVYKYGGQFIANNTLRQTTAFTATAGQTTFTVSYSVGFVDVFYNGAKLAAAEFTATNGTSIVLGTACVVNDIVEVVAYNYTVGAFTGVGGSGTTNFHPKWTASGTLGNSLIFDNGTNVGIGTSTPNYAATNRTTLDINGTNESLLSFSNSGTGRGYIFNNVNGQTYWTEGSRSMEFYIAGAGFMGFGTNNAERMRITSGGNILIGATTSDTGRLQIQASGAGTLYGHSLLLTDSSTSKNAFLISHRDGETRLMSTWGGSGINSDMTFWTTLSNGNQAERMRITSGGNVSIGGGDTGEKLNIVGGNIKLYSYQNVSEQYRYIGTEYGQGNGNNRAEVRFGIDGSDTRTFVSFATAASGGNITERMRITSAGQVLKPSNPAFRVYNSVNGFWYVNHLDTLIFDATEYNIGNCYNTSNGRFTAPVAGVYQFNFYTIVYGNQLNGAISIRKNGGAPTSGHNIHFSPYYTSTAWSNVVYTTSLYLNAGDYVFLINSTGVQLTIHGDDWSSFSGYLVG